MRNAVGGLHVVGVEELMAFGAVVAVDRTVKLIHDLAPRLLVEAVDVLGDHRLQLAPGFQLGQGQMRGVGFGVQGEHLVLIEAVKLGGVLHKEGMGQNGLGGIGILLVVEAVLAAKVGDSRLGGAARSTKKHDITTFCYPISQNIKLGHGNHTASF